MYREQGTALVFILLILFVVSIVSIHSMQSAMMESRMAANVQQYLRAFTAAESGLAAGWKTLLETIGGDYASWQDTVNIEIERIPLSAASEQDNDTTFATVRVRGAATGASPVWRTDDPDNIHSAIHFRKEHLVIQSLGRSFGRSSVYLERGATAIVPIPRGLITSERDVLK